MTLAHNWQLPAQLPSHPPSRCIIFQKISCLSCKWPRCHYLSFRNCPKSCRMHMHGPRVSFPRSLSFHKSLAVLLVCSLPPPRLVTSSSLQALPLPSSSTLRSVRRCGCTGEMTRKKTLERRKSEHSVRRKKKKTGHQSGKEELMLSLLRSLLYRVTMRHLPVENGQGRLISIIPMLMDSTYLSLIYNARTDW